MASSRWCDVRGVTNCQYCIEICEQFPLSRLVSDEPIPDSGTALKAPMADRPHRCMSGQLEPGAARFRFTADRIGLERGSDPGKVLVSSAGRRRHYPAYLDGGRSRAVNCRQRSCPDNSPQTLLASDLVRPE